MSEVLVENQQTNPCHNTDKKVKTNQSKQQNTWKFTLVGNTPAATSKRKRDNTERYGKCYSKWKINKSCDSLPSLTQSNNKNCKQKNNITLSSSISSDSISSYDKSNNHTYSPPQNNAFNYSPPISTFNPFAVHNNITNNNNNNSTTPENPKRKIVRTSISIRELLC
ncbi:hypothetical protein ABK040_004706 [Willaertia magna]